jgi:DNA-binding transcriptional regulator LsrR (DeoR family)
LPRKQHVLLRHEAILERSLRDLVAGIKTSHLSDDEVSITIAGLHDRLSAIRGALADRPGDHSSEVAE